MIPTALLEDRVRFLVASDTGQLATPGPGLLVALVMSAFTPGRATDIAGLTLATFVGSTAKIPTPGTQADFMDPLTGENLVQLIAPAGGWNWKCTAAPTPPQTIYGVVITDSTQTITYGSQLLPTPVTITNIGDAITIGDIRMGLPVGSWNDDPVGE
jgi:hypothetical protein